MKKLEMNYMENLYGGEVDNEPPKLAPSCTEGVFAVIGFLNGTPVWKSDVDKGLQCIDKFLSRWYF